MYHYVEDKDFLKRARKACASLLQELEIRLREKGMNTQFFLIGTIVKDKRDSKENL